MPDELVNKIDSLLLSVMNDINAYLMDDSVPMENYQSDIDFKLNEARHEILKELKA